MAEKDIPDPSMRIPIVSVQQALLEIISRKLAGIEKIIAKRPQGTDDHCLNITGISDIPSCSLWALDARSIRWEYCPEDRRNIDAGQTADIVTALVADESGPYEKLEDFNGDDTVFKGIVGRELLARGLSVELQVFEDKKSFSAATDIMVTKKQANATNSERDRSGESTARDQCDTRAYVDDSGFIFCDIEYWDGVQAEEIAEDVARRIQRVADVSTTSGNRKIPRSEDE